MRTYNKFNNIAIDSNIKKTKTISFVKETYRLFAASMIAGAAGAYIGVGAVNFISQYFLPLIILEFALLFGLFFAKNKPGLNLIALFGFVLMTGLMSGPLLAHTLSNAGGGIMIGNVFAMTSLIFGFMSFFAIKTTIDFSNYTKPLMISLFVIIIFSVINLFLGNSLLSIIISAIAVILFSIMVIYDTQNIINGNYETPIDGAIGLYLDFLNIFMSLLHLANIFGSED